MQPLRVSPSRHGYEALSLPAVRRALRHTLSGGDEDEIVIWSLAASNSVAAERRGKGLDALTDGRTDGRTWERLTFPKVK